MAVASSCQCTTKCDCAITPQPPVNLSLESNPLAVPPAKVDCNPSEIDLDNLNSPRVDTHLVHTAIEDNQQTIGRLRTIFTDMRQPNATVSI